MEDPIIADNTTMTGAERRLSEQLYCVLALTCRKRALQLVQQVPRGYGLEAWRQLCRKFGHHPPIGSRGMLQALCVEAVGPSLEKQRERSARNSRATRSLTGSQQDQRRWDRASSGNGRVTPSKTGVCGVWKREPPGVVGQQRRFSETEGVLQLGETWPQQE